MLEFLPHYLRRRFKEKYVIIESDDWGLERAVSDHSIEWAAAKFGREYFTRWTLDTLETKEDLELLFELLSSIRDNRGSHPVITANFITHNIDYQSNDKLGFIPISEGFNSGAGPLELYHQGITQGLIFPQLHGYSHYNLSALVSFIDTDEARESFANGFAACRSTIRGNLAFLQGELGKSNQMYDKIAEAAKVFRETFGYDSLTFIPPTFILDQCALSLLKNAGIEMIQSANRLLDTSGDKYSRPYFRKSGGFVWSVRNARLDPFKGYDFDHLKCIASISSAFENNYPAVIDFHRVNFSGRFNPEYRNRTLKELRMLFKGILKRWPDAIFTHSQKFYQDHWQQ